MRLLWLCNSIPGVVRGHISGKPAGAVNWVDHVLSGLRARGYEIRLLCRGSEAVGRLDAGCSYRCFGLEPAHVYPRELEDLFRVELRGFKPDVIHSWGVEYSHTLAMVNAAEAEGCLDRMAASIQGLCAVLALHYTDGIPAPQSKNGTLRDILKKDTIAHQQKKFALRGELERRAVEKLGHVIGRTGWDRAHTQAWNPAITYHFCNETLREEFYTGAWRYDTCRRHRIFASSCAYPIKGFHYLLEAFAEIAGEYPDAVLCVTGPGFLAGGLRRRLRRGSYDRYLARLARKYGLEGRIEFLGSLSAQAMKQAYLDANVFVLPSTMENSPNSLGEAMLLGTPCVAADVGGVRDLMGEGEGIVYPAGDASALAAGLREVFALEARAADLGTAARAHARRTHDPEQNLQTLIRIYETLA